MLHQKIEGDLREALKTGDKDRTGVLRFLIAAVKNRQIEIKAKDREYLSDEETIVVICRQIKQRKDSITEYKKGGRADLAEKEEKELAILEKYAPAQMEEETLRQIVREKIKELPIGGKSGYGKLMGAVMAETKGQADGNAVRKIVEEELARLD
jgi:uncharacterized protein YqeY